MTFDLKFDLQGQIEGQRTGCRILSRNYVSTKLCQNHLKRQLASLGAVLKDATYCLEPFWSRADVILRRYTIPHVLTLNLTLKVIYQVNDCVS